MDCQHEEGIEAACCIKSSQIGLSEIIVNDIGYTMDWHPAPMLLVQPTDRLTEEFSKDRIKTLIRDNPRIRKKVSDNESNLTNIRFDGGFLAMGSANTPRSLAGKPIRKVYMDEIDGYPPSSGIEGDPVQLAWNRSETFPNRFIWLFSTPTIKKVSRIEKLWEQSDQRRFFVPCPACKQLQFLKWSNVKFKNHDPTTSEYECGIAECKARWNQHQVNDAVQAGCWIATKPENRKNKIAGFHIWRIYSPWSSMEDIVRRFLACKDIPDQLRVWKNTCLGECDEIDGEGIENETIRNRVEDYGGYDPEIPNQRPVVPKSVLVLVATVDVQKDRLELFVAGFGPDEEVWAIEKLDFNGDPLRGEVWERLDSHLQKEFVRDDGVTLKIATCFVDSGDKAQHVYAFTKPRQRRNIYAVKGSSFPNKPIVSRANRVGPRKVALFEIGTDTAKDMIFGRLGMEYKVREGATNCPGFIHFPRGFGFDHEYFEQLTAEKYTIKHRNGVPFRAWVNIRSNKRNEALDLMVYAFAAFYNLKADMPRIAKKLERKAEAAKDANKPRESVSESEAGKPAEETTAKNETTELPSPPKPEAKPARRFRRPNFATNWKI